MVPLINRRMPSFRSVIEEEKFNTEATKKNRRRTLSDGRLPFWLLLRVLGVEAPSNLMDEWLWELCVKRSLSFQVWPHS
jgi:hypothetical protein